MARTVWPRERVRVHTGSAGLARVGERQAAVGKTGHLRCRRRGAPGSGAPNGGTLDSGMLDSGMLGGGMVREPQLASG
ncbi:hypothetical protein [Protofrankia symbiont of Coriaria ruscifolia]|uniref:hypothetical protein n=1 Tax=Protofrankia symbiont of Coriaria ruscifolia TaxID=1306542 RepID=UPI0010419959|nr:hypothetical protein [Protofrankia symbiont of Coriaria ruscifolia]